MTRDDLSPRELAILELASGTGPSLAAAMVVADPEAVEALAREFGWPGTLRRLKSAATAIKAGDRQHEGDLPAAEPAGEVGTEAPATAEVTEPAVPVTAPAPEETTLHVPTQSGPSSPPPPDPAALAEAQAGLTRAEQHRARAMLAALEPAPSDHATLVIPTLRLVHADGREVVIEEGWVIVQIDSAGLADWLSDDPSDETSPVKCTNFGSRTTDEGAAILRKMAAEIDGDS